MAFKHKYDVFISYDHEMKGAFGCFINDLDSALKLKGINTFKSTGCGGSFFPDPLLLEAIEQSKISIVAFSPNYTKYTELLEILNCQCKMFQVVLPVFLNVDPSQVFELKGDFGKVLLRKLMNHFRKWRSRRDWVIQPSQVAQQLRAFREVPGWDLTTLKSARGEVIEEITHSIRRILDRSPQLLEDDHLVGIDSHVNKVLQLLSGRLDKILIVGITGEEGAGKTTLAKVIYNRIGHTFEYKYFFENVSEVSRKNGLDLVKVPINKRALIVLDDVCNMGEFKALCATRNYYGPGSRIIITTTSKRILDQVGANDIYTLKIMSFNDSLELFSWHAFKQEIPKEDFVGLSRDAVQYCRGLPLSLKVLGSYFFGRNVDECRSAFSKLKKMVRTHDIVLILPTLKISYEGLSDLDKDIFLVIYQFFIGKDRNSVVLNDYTPDTEIGLAVLIQRCFVSIDENNKLQMHELVKDLAREILDEKTKPDWMNDVFLSFRGEETRSSFTSHLYSALRNAGIKAFMDDRLERGADILSSLLSVIKESRISVVIFSTNYAGSRWCLDELEKIMDCQRTKGQKVLPVFFNVDPSEVRKQTGTFGEAFEGLLRRISTTQEKVSSWKSALTEAANLSGWDSKNYSTEVELIDNILRTIFVMVDDGTYLPIANHPVGVNSRVQNVIPLLSGGLNDVCIIGIWGMRGVGKTTLAKAIYNEVGGNFDGKSFLANVREVWEQDKGPISLQEQLVSDTLKMRRLRLHNVEMGKIIINEGLHRKRVLIVFDDVNRLDQLDALCGSREWFGQGSTIVITTTDKHLLHILQVDSVHKLEPMEESESLELFSWHAFKNASPVEDFISLSRNIVKYCGGLPLALQVLGCYLFGREKPEWDSTFERLKRIPDHEIQEKLKISFDGLSHDTEKEIFLDISCFFIGTDRNYATQILNDCGCFAEVGISVLIQRSLVTVDKRNKLRMHDLLRDMGREINRKESPKFPEERSRLWLHEDVLDVLRNHTGTKTIEGLALKFQGTNEVHLKTKAFKKMRRLRLLKLDHVPLAGDYDYLPKNIRWLYWNGFPSKCIPADFYMGSVVAAELKSSKLKVFWKEPQLLENLKFLNLSHSCYLTQTPDFSKLPNLEELVLKDCPSLSMIHWNIGYLNKLLLVNLKGCKSLCNLPRSFYKLKSLETLILSGCSKIDKLEEDIEQMASLTTLMADNTGISHVPHSLIRAKSIQYVSLCGHEGSSTDVFPSLVWSWLSPMNNPKSLGQASLNLPSIQINSYNDLSSILSSHSQIRSLRLKCQSEFHVRQDIAIICAELKTKQNATQMSDMGSSALSNCYLSCSLWIHLGEHIKDLEERISQGSTSGDKYPEWLTFTGEGSSILFRIPLVAGCGLKGMTLHITYSHFLANLSSMHLMTVLIINHTKATIQLHKKEALLSPSLEERKAMISNLDPNDEVQVIVVFGPEFSVKNTTVHLIYGESVDENAECSNATQMNSKRCQDKEEDDSSKRAKRR